MVLPYAQGLAEISVSDANKLHLTTVPEVIDSLRVWVGVSADATSAAATAPVDVAYLGKLRAYACSALAQLAASPVTLPMLLGHPLLDDLEQVPALPDSSKDARNDAMAAIFAVRLHEKASAAASASAAAERLGAGSGHVMISYAWSVQETIKRLRTSLVSRSYVVWLDIDCMAGSTMDAMVSKHRGYRSASYVLSQPKCGGANDRWHGLYRVRPSTTLPWCCMLYRRRVRVRALLTRSLLWKLPHQLSCCCQLAAHVLTRCAAALF